VTCPGPTRFIIYTSFQELGKHCRGENIAT